MTGLPQVPRADVGAEKHFRPGGDHLPPFLTDFNSRRLGIKVGQTSKANPARPGMNPILKIGKPGNYTAIVRGNNNTTGVA